MITVIARFGRFDVTAAVNPTPPLGWRFWTLAGFPGDPIDPRPYGGSRCLPRAVVDLDQGPRWLCAMELDRSLRLFASHDLFPCDDQAGAADFATAMLAERAREPSLF